MFHLRLAHKVYASASKTKIIEIKVELGFYLLIFKCVSVPYCFHSLRAQTFANVMEGADSVRLVGAISGAISAVTEFL